jgi:hypothetical protein
MAGNGKNHRGQFPWEAASEPSQAAPMPRQQGKAVRVEAAAPALQAVAVSKANEISKAIGSPGYKGGNEIQTLEILQIPSEMTRARVLELLCFLDPTALDPETFTRGGQILMKSMRAGDGSASWCP